MISRALLSEPAILLADEPTQGVDVGARAEIYGILRDASARGVPVVIASSDAKELEGLCDQVLVMSRGQVVATLRGDEVTEERIVGAAVSARTEVASVPKELRQAKARGFRRFLLGDYAPPALVALVIVLLAAVLTARNENYLFNFNVATLLTAATALGFIALGQNVALLTGGIDLSVGPLAGFLVVVASFFVNDGKPAATVLLGLVLMLAVAVADRPRQRLAHPVRPLHPDRRDAHALHRLRRPGPAAATGTGRLHRPVVPGLRQPRRRAAPGRVRRAASS